MKEGKDDEKDEDMKEGQVNEIVGLAVVGSIIAAAGGLNAFLEKGRAGKLSGKAEKVYQGLEGAVSGAAGARRSEGVENLEETLDIDALVAALDDEHLYGAGLDVVYPEPLPDGHPLLTHPKVILSPHIAGGTVEATEGLARSAAEQIMTALHGTLPKFPVNPDVWRSDQSRRPQ